MKTVIAYVKDNKDKTFEELPFNEVDALILSSLSYANFYESKYYKNNYLILNDLTFDKDDIKYINRSNLFKISTLKLLTSMQDSIRYRCIIKDSINKYNKKTTKQFSACTFEFDDFIFVAYRGTDLTILGWKEDFALSYKGMMASYDDAKDYLASRNKDKIYIGGHSKGGHVAIYSYLKAKKNIKDKVVKVYDFDGPGFFNDSFKKSELKYRNKIEKYSPKSSIFGVMLDQVVDLNIVSTFSGGLVAHSPFTWLIKNNKFINGKKLNTVDFQLAFKRFVELVSDDECKKFTAIVFNALLKSELDSLDKIIKKPLEFRRIIKNEYKNLEENDKIIFKDCIFKFINVYKDVKKENIYGYFKN